MPAKVKKPMSKKTMTKKSPAKKPVAKKLPAKKPVAKKTVNVAVTKLVKSTVCLEGYKISKAGRCVKDKNYKVVMASVPSAPAPPPLAPKGPRMTPIYLKESDTVSFGIADKKAKDLLEKQRKPANFAEAIAMEAAKKREAAKAPAPVGF